MVACEQFVRVLACVSFFRVSARIGETESGGGATGRKVHIMFGRIYLLADIQGARNRFVGRNAPTED